MKMHIFTVCAMFMANLTMADTNAVFFEPILLKYKGVRDASDGQAYVLKFEIVNRSEETVFAPYIPTNRIIASPRHCKVHIEGAPKDKWDDVLENVFCYQPGKSSGLYSKHMLKLKKGASTNIFIFPFEQENADVYRYGIDMKTRTGNLFTVWSKAIRRGSGGMSGASESLLESTLNPTGETTSATDVININVTRTNSTQRELVEPPP